MRSAASALALLACAACAEPPGDAAAALTAEPWLLAIDGSGTWPEVGPDGTPVVRAWVDARVANLRHHKRVLVEVASPYPVGWVRTLHPASYEGELGGGSERWGADTIEIFPERGPQGEALAGVVVVRLRLQHDADGDGADDMVVTPWAPLHGDGEPAGPEDDPWLVPGSPAAGDGLAADVVFAPFDDPGARLLAEIDALIARQRAAPGQRHTLHAAVFNINDPEMIDRVIAAHQAGVEVRLVIDGRKLRPWYGWYQGDDQLLAAGVPLLGAFRAGGAMHDKIVLLDGRRVATGSFNWETGARFDNHESLLVTGAADLVAAYAGRFTALAGGVLAPRAAAAPGAPAQVSFAPDEEPHRILAGLVDGARDHIRVAMFTAKDITWDEGGRATSLFEHLCAARARGLDVRIVVDHGIHEASEYHGMVSPDDPSDERLEACGIHVVRADNQRGPYASMHHKFAVIDGATVVTGAYNWYHDAAFRNDEDQLVLHDPALARRFTGELVDLLRQYDPAWDPAEWPQVELRIAARNDRTRWGDTVALAGDLAELGAWDPRAGPALDPAHWPVWTGGLTVPVGVHLRWKLVTRHPDGSVTWEPGADRRLTAPAEPGRHDVAVDVR